MEWEGRLISSISGDCKEDREKDECCETSNKGRVLKSSTGG